MTVAEINFITQQEHLKNVSRTFALTIPLLPEPLIDYVSNAYLLCRIADTIEDDPIADREKKIFWLKSFATFCSNDFLDEMSLLTLHKQALDLVREGAVKAEYRLMEDMLPVIQRTRSFPTKIRAILSRGVSILSYGMSRSLEGVKVNCDDDVDRYCYFVAGVVGELLAALFAEHNRLIDKKELMNLSVSFGEGLQLTNILKDRNVDKTRGASFLPEGDPAAPDEVVTKYISICQGHLDDALSFILKIPKEEYGMRLFCLLNILMATATLKLISKTPDSEKSLKITRNKVKILYIMSKLVAHNNLFTRILFSMVSHGVNRIKRDPKALRDKVSCWEKQIFFI